MSVQTPLPSFSRSDLRNPEVIRRAMESPIRIHTGAADESLILLPERVQVADADLRDLAELFVRTVVELRRAEPSAPMLGDVGYVARWAASDRDRFLSGFAEALAESLRLGNPAPARGYISAMSSAGPSVDRPDLTGKVSTTVAVRLANELEGLAG